MSVDLPLTISVLLERIDSGSTEYESAIAAMPDERVLAPNTIGTWSVARAD